MRQANSTYKKEIGKGIACTKMWNNNKEGFYVRERDRRLVYAVISFIVGLGS